MTDFFTGFSSSIGGLLQNISGNLSLDLALKVIIAYGLVIWFATVIWVIKDITNRSTNILMHVFSILLIIGLTPIFWLPIYLLIRPNTTIFERYYEESSLEALSQNGASDECDETSDQEHEPCWGLNSNDNDADSPESSLICPYCEKGIDRSHHFCPHCGKELLVKCIACKESIHGSWKFCPKCGSEQEEGRSVKASKQKISKVNRKSQVLDESMNNSLPENTETSPVKIEATEVINETSNT